MNTTTPICDILAMARLGSNVKKTVVLCSPGVTREKLNKEEEEEEEEREVKEREDEVVYTSLQWSGMV